jgi:hypothetical protein
MNQASDTMQSAATTAKLFWISMHEGEPIAFPGTWSNESQAWLVFHPHGQTMNPIFIVGSNQGLTDAQTGATVSAIVTKSQPISLEF